MRCSKAREHVSQEIDAVLPPDATGNLRDHLETCAECRAYREDLRLGQRLLAATEPQLPDNFEWKLQLKLNQALQQTAGEASYPWQEDVAVDRWNWLRNFGAATAVGLAAVLAVAMFLGPVGQQNEITPLAASTTDRRPLFQPGNGGLSRPGTRQMVATGGQTAPRRAAAHLDRGWSGANTEDLKIIRRLRAENQRLASMLLQYQRANEMLRTQLDTSGARALDLQHDR